MGVAPAALPSDWVRRENTKRGTTAWKVTRSAVAGDLELAGYTDQVSVTSGQPFRLLVTSSARSYDVRAFRLGWYGGAQGRLVWTSARLPGHQQSTARLAAGHMVSTSWSPSATVATTGWLPGSYQLRHPGDPRHVRPSLRRQRRAGAGQLRAADHRAGRAPRLPLAYLTPSDVDAGTHHLPTARGIVWLGHDEYWTTGMRDRDANLLLSMAAGPLGRSHPSVGDLAGVHDSASTTTGTGGAVGS